jgi:hypothetical protein
MSKRVLIIPSNDYTIEEMISLPLKVQIELALYVVDTTDLCTLLNVHKGFLKENDWKNKNDYKKVYEALTNKNNFVIPYISKH